MGSLLAYFRPLRLGETLRYEFFYKPGEVMVHPGLGRLVFLLQPERVRLHWLTDGDGNDWTGLAVDNAVDDPAPGPGAKPLPLKADAWNTLRLSLSKEGVKLELNGTPVYEGKLGPDNDRVFGLFHYKDQTEARVRQVVLRGDWPEKLPPEVLGRPREDERTIPLPLLRQSPPDAYRLAPGDVLGVWVEGVLGDKGQAPPLHVPEGGLPPSGRAPLTGPSRPAPSPAPGRDPGKARRQE